MQSCFVKASEGPEYQHIDGRSVLVSVVGIRKYRKMTNLENMTHDPDKSSLTDNAVCGLRCLVAGSTSLSSTTRGDDVKCSRVNIAVHLLINIVVYS
jgi:hypothetical protein